MLVPVCLLALAHKIFRPIARIKLGKINIAFNIRLDPGEIDPLRARQRLGVDFSAPHDGDFIGAPLLRQRLDRIEIANSLLHADVPYAFNVRVRNFLGETMTMQHTVTRREFSVPQIMIEGENVIRTSVDKPLYVMASVKLPIDDGSLPAECTVPYPEMDFTWSLGLRD